MSTLHLNLNDNDLVKQVCKVAFPNYHGRKVQIRYNCKTKGLSSYWDGGSRSYYAIVRLSDNEVLNVPQNHPVFTPMKNNQFDIPSGFVVVEHCIFCGKDLGLTIYTPENPVLESGQKDELTRDEKIVLHATGYKSSYAGISNYRYHEAKRATGITLTRYNEAKESLIKKGMLNKRGAITNQGRNAKGNDYNWPK